MEATARHTGIVARLRREGRVDVAELSDELGTSEVTIRRDLDQLAEAGVLQRVHGGAVSLLMRGDELPFAMREVEASEAKARIGVAAAELLRDGEAVVVDSGTTGLAVARALSGRRMTVMPLSLPNANALTGSASTTLLIPGGSARFGEGSLVGPMTEASLRRLRFDTVVLTCCGFSLDAGVTAHDLQDAAVKRAALDSANRVVLVAEGAKFARTALAVVCPYDRVDIVVTDDSAPADALSRLRSAGVQVVQA
jgi:DeoR/GlpR family transcriptional regulator of sugar metabolism